MSVYSRVSDAYRSSFILPFDNFDKIVLMSDCHRGDGRWNDNFSENQSVFYAALNYYYNNNFTYIELGDGDDLWENRRMEKIVDTYSDCFWMMSKFYKKNRFFMIYGNHDMVKKKEHFMLQKCNELYDEMHENCVPIFPDIKIYESILLKHRENNIEILLLHGHQGDILNDYLWKLSRFLVRYIWSPLEIAGLHDPTSTARNHTRRIHTERKLTEWANTNNKLIITGHTHRPVFPKVGDSLYFNDGSCVHPRSITAIELAFGGISLVKWHISTRFDNTLYVAKETLEGPVSLDKIYHTFCDSHNDGTPV